MGFNRGPGGQQTGSGEIEDTPVTIAQGGTNATTAAQARTNLGIGTMGTQPSNSVFITGGTITGISPLPVASGGTGASGQAEARTNLGISTAATQATEYFATAAQGALADSATQPGDLATVATSGSYTDLSDKPSIPSSLTDLGITDGTSGQVLTTDGSGSFTFETAAGSGTVTSVDLSVPTGLVVSGNPVTSSGTLAVTYDTGYAIPTTASQTNWDTAFGWGDHSTEGYLTSFTETDPVVGAITGIVKADGAGNISAAVSGTDYASSAQGALADSAVQPGDNISTLTNDSGFTTNTGTVTSVDMTVPTGLAVSGNPVTSSGTLAVTYSAGYAIPTTTKQSNWDDAYTFTAAFPSQTSQSGKYLTTDGSVLSWAAVDALPSQSGNSGKFLTTDGTDASWATLPPGGQYLGTAATKAIMYNAQSIAENITIDGTYNALSAGPITIDSTYTVTVSSGAVWTIV